MKRLHFLSLLFAPLFGDDVSIDTLWRGIKRELIGPKGEEYFHSALKGAAMPELRGRILSRTSVKAILAMSDDKTPEVTLHLYGVSLPEKAVPGAILYFYGGVAKAFEQEPFMLTFDVGRGGKLWLEK